MSAEGDRVRFSGCLLSGSTTAAVRLGFDPDRVQYRHHADPAVGGYDSARDQPVGHSGCHTDSQHWAGRLLHRARVAGKYSLLLCAENSVTKFDPKH